jgi:AcrR family transcriptional regulator
MGRPKTGIEADTADAVSEAINQMARDRSLPRTASKLAELAGVGRATLYRAFEARPELRDMFNRLVEQSPATERSKLEADLADRLAEIRLLKERITALTSTVEHLLRDNNALRERLAQRGATIAEISQPRRRKENR